MKNLFDRFADPSMNSKLSFYLILFLELKKDGFYGSKEDIDDQEDFYPFVLIPLTVPSS